MVKRYEPGQQYYQYEEDPTLVMKETQGGEWVSHETYINETHRLNNQINRQKAVIAKLQEQMKELKEEKIIAKKVDWND
jgi:hypothetical protein